jgi:translocation and assembly module TamB
MRRLLGLLLALPLAAALAALLAANTAPGRAAIERLAAAAVPGLTLAGLDGAIPGRILLAQAELADAEGPWLRLAGLVLQPDWPALLRGEARVALLAAEEVTLLRLPAAAAPPAPAGPRAAPAPALPELPLPVALERLEIARLRIAAPVAGLPLDLSLHGAARLAEGRLALTLAAAEAGGGARADLDAALAGGEARLRLALAEPPGGRIPGLLGLPAGATQVDVTLSGPLADIVLDAAAQLRPAAPGDAREAGPASAPAVALRLSGRVALPPGGGATAALDAELAAAPLPGLPLPLRARLDATLPPDGPLALSRLALAAPGAEAEASGEIALDTLGARLSLRLSAAAAAPFAALLPEGLSWAGLSAEAQLDGPLADPALRVALRAERIEAAGRVAEQVSLDLDIAAPLSAPRGAARLAATLEGQPLSLDAEGSPEAGRLRLDRVAARAAGVEATARLMLDPAALRAEGEAALTAADLAPLGALAGVALAGAAELRLALAPAADGAQAATVAARLEGGRVAGTPVGGRVEAEATLRPEARQGEASLRLSGEAAGVTLAAEAAAALAEGALRLDLSRLEARHPAAGLRLAAPGTVAVSPEGAATLSELRFAAAGGGAVAIGGRWGPEEAELTARLSALPAALAEAFAPGLGLGGTLSGEARLTGPLAAPDLAVTLSGSGLGAQAAAGLPPGTLRIAARAPGLARLEADLAADLGAAGRLAGRLSLPGGFGAADPLSLRLAGQGDLARLAAPRLAAGADRVAGRLELDVTAGGRIGAPTLAGSARLSGGRWENAALGATLTDIAAVLRGSGEAVTIERLTAATPGNGRLSARGRIGLGAGLPLDLTLEARGARPVRSDLAGGTFDADLRLTGEALGRSLLAGSVTLRRLEITIPERMPPSLRSIPNLEERGAGAGAARAAPEASLPEVDLAVTVEAPRAVFVRGQGVDAELGGRMDLGGTIAAPQPVGGFALRRGTLSLLDRRLDFTRGTLGFDGTLSPTLDFVATSRVREVALTATVSGSAAAPDIAFSSVPELPQGEILARLLFDRPLGQLSPFQIAQLGAAVAGAAGLTGGGEGLLGRIRRALALDRLAIGSEQRGEAEAEATLEGGRYVADGVFVGVTQGAQGGPPRVGVQIDLLPRLRLEGRTGGPEGGGRLGLTYEVEY